MNLFQSMGLPKTELPQEEKEEVTEEIAASRREIEQQLRNGLLKNQEVTIEVEEKPLRMAGNSNGMEQMMQIQSMLDQMTPKKRSKRTVSVEEALDILTEQEANQLVNKDDIHAEALKLAEKDIMAGKFLEKGFKETFYLS